MEIARIADLRRLSEIAPDTLLEERRTTLSSPYFSAILLKISSRFSEEISFDLTRRDSPVVSETVVTEEKSPPIIAFVISSTFFARSLSSVKSLYKYLFSKGIIKVNPADDVHGFKPDKRPPKALTDVQIDTFLSAPVLNSIKGFRDKAILEIMYAIGYPIIRQIAVEMRASLSE